MFENKFTLILKIEWTKVSLLILLCEIKNLFLRISFGKKCFGVLLPNFAVQLFCRFTKIRNCI